MQSKILFSLFCLFNLLGFSQLSSQQEQIIDRYLKNGAWNHHYLSKEWDEWINLGLEKDSTIAYLWQQKALPLWKQRKYQLAISYYDKAVELDAERWLSRRGFLKCIFAKDYEGALIDLDTYQREFGFTFEQDHSLDFYRGLCYLQLNQFETALEVFENDMAQQKERYGLHTLHYLDRFYLAITHYELGNYPEAVEELNLVLQEYPNFSDAQFYKAICLSYLGLTAEIQQLIKSGRSNFEKGYTINEDSSIYEFYPYQISWQWNSVESLLR
ncbi:MAG: tetratricopeptide repeat protein [Flavobacteriales bacterium]|nr:tetratricopeptide repeat protein [Flavobacteriales bacterium]